ncbi:hypothetical protein PRAC110570_11545 [Propionibacterium acidifaciens]
MMFLLDANVLIEAKNRYYGRHETKSFLVSRSGRFSKS